MWSILNFGKHKGKSLPEVILRDPDWFFWAIEDNVLNAQGFGAEARDLDFKAGNIKTPRPATERWRIKYIFDRRGKFCGFELVQVSSAAEAYSDRLDLSVSRQQKRYDKTGSKLLLRDFRFHYFGGQSAKLTRKKCWEFFDDTSNFCNPIEPECRETHWSKLISTTHGAETMKNGSSIRAIDAMFVWTPDTELYQASYPLRGKVDVTTIPESTYNLQHPRSFGACNSGWKTADLRRRSAQRLVTEMIYEDNVPIEEVRRAFTEVDEFETFPFSTERQEND